MEARIPPIYGEDYPATWGKADYRGKRVLDIGASNGDTADFFLRNGAVAVIAVELDEGFYRQLEENSRRIPEIIPLWKDAGCPRVWEELIQTYKPDVVKADCEGCEVHLFTIPDEVFRIPEQYIIELHMEAYLESFVARCTRNGYEVVDVNTWASPVSIVYARRIKKDPEQVGIEE